MLGRRDDRKNIVLDSSRELLENGHMLVGDMYLECLFKVVRGGCHVTRFHGAGAFGLAGDDDA